MHRVENCRIGDTFKAIDSEEELSKTIGINIYRYKMLAFAIGSFFNGIAGALFAHHYYAIDPTVFGMGNTLYLLVSFPIIWKLWL